MAEISSVIEPWIDIEVTDEEIPNLKENIMFKVNNENRVELIPFHGFLQMKDKMWVGKVKRLTPGSGILEAIQSGSEPVEIYVLEVHHKIVEEIESYASAVNLGWGVTAFALSLSSAIEEVILQHFANYFVAVYGEMPKQASLKRPQILGLGSKLQGLLSNRSPSDLKAIWSVKAEVFTTALRDPLSLSAESTNLEGYQIMEMSLMETLYAADHWKYKTDSVTYRFATSCYNSMVLGAFPTGSSVPVSWVYASWDGAISGLQTVEGHKKKGLARAIVKKLSEILIDNGVIPFAYIEEDMEGSNIPAALFTSLGFEVYKDVKFQWSFPCCRTCHK